MNARIRDTYFAATRASIVAFGVWTRPSIPCLRPVFFCLVISIPALILEIANEQSLATPFPSRAVRDLVLSFRGAKRTDTRNVARHRKPWCSFTTESLTRPFGTVSGQSSASTFTPSAMIVEAMAGRRRPPHGIRKRMTWRCCCII